MSIFTLKIIACISMFLDHIKYYTELDNFITIYLGRLAFPIFAFAISEGYIHTKSKKKYCFRLLLFTIISQYPYYLFEKNITQHVGANIGVTLLFGLFAIIAYDYFNNKIEKAKTQKYITICYKLLKYIIPLILIYGASILKLQYTYYGVAIIFLFYIFRNHKKLRISTFIITTILYFFIKDGNKILLNEELLKCLMTCLAVVPIMFYNGSLRQKS